MVNKKKDTIPFFTHAQKNRSIFIERFFLNTHDAYSIGRRGLA